MNEQKKSQAVVVLGMHRSGTSLVARALEIYGISTGSNLLTGGAENPKGFFEARDILQLNKDILSALNSRWDYLHCQEIVTLSQDKIEAFEQRAYHIIEKDFSGTKLWGFKEPRTLRLMPFWTNFFNRYEINTKCIIVTRNPDDIVESLFLRNLLPYMHSYALIAVYYRELLEIMRSNQVSLIDYDKLLDTPENELVRVGDQLNLPILDAERLRIFCSDFISKDLKRSSGKQAIQHPIRDTLLKIHQKLGECSKVPAMLQSEELAALWKELKSLTNDIAPNWYDHAITATAELATQYRKETRRLNSGAQALQQRVAHLKHEVEKRDTTMKDRHEKIIRMEKDAIKQKERVAHLKQEIVERDQIITKEPRRK